MELAIELKPHQTRNGQVKAVNCVRISMFNPIEESWAQQKLEPFP